MKESAGLWEVAGCLSVAGVKSYMLFLVLSQQDKSSLRARSSGNALAKALNWVRTQLSPLDPPILLWGLLGAVVTIRVVQTLLAPRPLQSSKPSREEKRKQTSKKDPRAASEQAAVAPNSNSSDSGASRRKK